MMFREMRRKDKQLPEDGVRRMLEECNHGVLGTNSEQGYPYTVPLNFIYLNEKIYFHCAGTGKKIDDIELNEKVSFCLVDEVELLSEKFDTNYSSVILLGRAREVKNEEKRAALEGFIKKYSPEYMDAGMKYIDRGEKGVRVFGIEIDHITGKFQK